MVGVKTPKTSNYVPVSTLGVDSKILDLKYSYLAKHSLEAKVG